MSSCIVEVVCVVMVVIVVYIGSLSTSIVTSFEAS